MRIVIDMQGAQTESRTRGIGRYSMAFAEAIVRNRGTHDVWLALNGLFPETIMPIRDAFAPLLPRDRIRVWEAPGPVAAMDGNRERRQRAELVREAFLASLDPDIVHVTSLFEGFVDDAVTSVGALGTTFPTSVTLYDLIPLHDPDRFLRPNPAAEAHYLGKLDALRRADLLLAISDFTARDARARLGLGEERVVNVSCAHDAIFRRSPAEPGTDNALFDRLRMKPRFVLTSGTIEPHKNLARLFAAIARVPADTWQERSLVLVGKFFGRQADVVAEMAARAGIAPGHLVITGYVSDDDLARLYNTCDLMVVPSLDEGFGLPALEAMACGAPTIGSRAASLPEIIGRDDALFDPTDVADMARVIAHALATPSFRTSLREGAGERVALFSWQTTACRALAAMESLVERRGKPVAAPAVHTKTPRPRLAFVSPLPPDKSGIADYAADCLPALAAHYDITLVSRGQPAFLSGDGESLQVRPPEWLRDNPGQVDRVLYQFGNSPFHDYMLPLARAVPGTVVLHDFFLSSLLAWLELSEQRSGEWTEALYESHGYAAVRERFRDPGAAKARYPANLGALRDTEGVVVHSEHARALGVQWLGADFVRHWRVVPQLKTVMPFRDRAAARRALRIPPDAFVICSFGAIDATKMNLELLDALAASTLASNPSAHLYFVGEPHGGSYGATLRRRADAVSGGMRIRVTGWTDARRFELYLAAADIAVQLRTDPRGETSRAILDCMAAGLPTVINAHGSAAEIPPEAALVLADRFSIADLTDALERLFGDRARRAALGNAARNTILRDHGPEACAMQYAQAIEAFHARSRTGLHALADAVAAIEPAMDARQTKALAVATAFSIPAARPQRQLLLDVTHTSQTDLRTGIQRVVRAMVLALLEAAPSGFRIEPVCLSSAGGGWHYRYARRFALGLQDCPTSALQDDVVDVDAGDVLVVLDLSGQNLVDADNAGLLSDLRRRGVGAYATIYDLLPVKIPERFPAGTQAGFEQWLTTTAGLDGVFCISAAVADDYRRWREAETRDRGIPFRIGWFRLGADIDRSDPSRGMPPDAPARLADFAARPTFLMVATIEPRKGHLQAIAAFDLLWRAGVDVNLVVVGAQGWTALPEPMRGTVPEIVARLSGHPERDRRLFWLEGISDEYLEAVYAASTCLLAASEGEGFGLPLIEAARHRIPILARDIPVFREVAGSHAAYFSGLAPVDLAEAVKAWLALHRGGGHPRSDDMPWQTWAESARQIAALIGQWEEAPAPTIDGPQPCGGTIGAVALI